MTELKPFQAEGVRSIYRFRGRALLCDEMGLGKTIQALEWIRKIPKRRPVIIVTPASVKYTWQAEAALHFNMRTEVLEGRMKKLKKLPGDVIILNYELLHSWLPALVRARPQCIIFDEIHYIKTLGTQRTKASRKLAADVASVIGLSGTPLTNRPIELWPILEIVCPGLFESHEAYAWRYCRPRWTPWGWTYDGATHCDELHAILRENCMIRRLKSEVLPELPPKTRAAVSFRLSSYSEYNRAQHDFIGWLKSISPTRAERAKKSKALTHVGYLLRLTAKLKLEWTVKWIEEFFISHPKEKLVALSMHTFVIDALKEKFPQAVIVDGRVTGLRRVETVRKFQTNSRANLLLGNWKAAGVGITLHAACNAVALDYPWTPGDLLQGEDRIHRIGQKRKVIIHYLVALHTIEEKLIKILRKKSSVLDAILNGTADPEDLSIFDELLAEMRKPNAA